MQHHQVYSFRIRRIIKFWSKSNRCLSSLTDDVPMASANSLVIAGKIPGAWFVQIKDAGHALPAQYPDKLIRVLQTFLSTTSNPG
jgi:hypothetical protein